ncbi:MAG TPA: flagellar hook-associated protein FlgK [Geobacteraceae bacterium]|nr:flagellar hook-associated protein FlgK [Geobacteraceae bacterium]
MGINSLFNIGTSGVTMARIAIEVTSENIANVNTDGYSRQNTVFKTGPVNTANGFPLGSGVQLAAVQRNHDELLQLQLVTGNSQYGESETKQAALEQIEPFFNEVTNDGLGQAMEDFFNAWQDLTVTPQGTAERQALLSRSQILVDTFHRLNTNLNDSLVNADSSLVGITADITDKAKSIASLNEQILQTERLGGNANELRDQRDYLTQELAKKVGISYAEQSDGTMTITLPGGEPLVQGNTYATLATETDAGTGLNKVMLTPIGGGAAVDVTGTIGGTGNSLGEIGGTLQVRDEIVPGYLAKLDEMARQLVTTVNSQHSAGYGLDGTQNNFFDPSNTTSADIALNSSLTTEKIAAAGQDPTGAGGPGDNTNALALAQLKSASFTFTVDGQTTSTTMAGFYNAFVSSVGIDTENAANSTAQNESFLRQLNTLRESNSGVSLDEELTNLIQYQRAFEASAKVISAAAEMLDTVMGLIR